MYGKVNVENIFRITELYTAFFRSYEPNHWFQGEVHNFWEIVFVIRGELGVTAGSDVITLTEGQAILHAPMEFHRLWTSDNATSEIVIISFDCENMPTLKSRIFMTDSDMCKSAAKTVENIRNNFKTSDRSVIGIEHKSSPNYQLAVKETECFVLNLISNDAVICKPPALRSAKNYSYIIKVLEENIDKNLSVSQIAKLCNMSEINLKKTFSKYSGMGIKKYYSFLIMNKAIMLLNYGMSVSETAAALGFEGSNYFSLAFKRVIGKSPSKYKITPSISYAE